MKTGADASEGAVRSGGGRGSGGRSLRAYLTKWPQRNARWIPWLLLVAVFLCGASLFPRSSEVQTTTYRLGTVQTKAVIANSDFPVNKDPATLEAERQEAMAAVPPVLVRQDTVAVQALRSLDRLQETLIDLRGNRPPDQAIPEDDDVAISPSVYLTLSQLEPASIFAQARGLLRECFDRGVVSAELEERLENIDRATLVSRGVDWVGPTHRFLGPQKIEQLLAARGDNSREALAVAELVMRFAQPNVVYDEQATAARKRLAHDAIDPSVGMVLKGEKIVGAHERITSEVLRKLESYEAHKQHLAETEGSGMRLGVVAGRALLLAMLLGGFSFYLASYRPEILRQLDDLTLLAASFGAFLLLGGLTLNALRLSAYLIPVAGFAVMVTLLYDERLALMATGFLTTIIGMVTEQGLIFVVVIGFGSVAAILSVHQLRDRRQLYRLLLYVPLTHIASLGVMGLAASLAFEQLLTDALYLVANPFIAAGFALFAVPLTETSFGKCTNLTLLELLDLNRPLLRRLMLEAPGTYHHSLMVGTLAEAGAQAIGANPLMARVQGYYHDIGKLRKPDYFIENLMAGRKNLHDKLAPTMSRLILEAHVRDGLALARESKLPKVVRDGIAQHHGTGVMTYFYHKAKQMGTDVPETEYRYPGPRPRSRETAVVFLADQVDAASRSLQEPTPSRLRGLVKQLVEKRAMEGELDESQLTLKDLAALRDAFVPILTALFHGRISYPTLEQRSAKFTSGVGSEPAAKAEG